MILISHRGNIEGPSSTENKPEAVDAAISAGFDVEIDVRELDGKLFLGHDLPADEVSLDWLDERKRFLWIHCKNMEAMDFFSGSAFNHFWHQEDDRTLTSHGFIWTYPGKPLSKKSIAVLPEVWTQSTNLDCLGVCSDFVARFQRTHLQKKFNMVHIPEKKHTQ